jgi:hypothetical protein
VDGADIPNYGIAMAALSSGEIRDPSLRTVRAAVVNSLLGLAVDRLLYDSGRAAGHRGPGATGLRKLADEQTREYRVGNGARFTTRAAASAYFHSSQFMAFYVRNVIEAQEKADIMGVKGGVLTPATEHAAIEKLRAWVRVQFARRASVTGWDGMSEQMLSAMAK